MEELKPIKSLHGNKQQTIATTVELFCGIGGFRLAAEERGIRTIWANDICSKACQVYRSCFGEASIFQGDIRDLVGEIPSHDLLTAGFPCQPFSSAGKKNGVRDPRSHVFHAIVEVLRRNQPNFFILENVKRLLLMEDGSHFAKILGLLAELDYNVEWRLVNAMHLGLPQNRQRVIIIGSLERNQVASASIKLAKREDFRDLDEENYERANSFNRWTEIGEDGLKFSNWGLAKKGKFFGYNLNYFSDAKPIVRLKNIIEYNADRQFDFTDSTLKRLEESTPVNNFIQGVQVLYNQGGGARMGYTIFGTDGVAPTLTSTRSRHYERYKIGDRYRRLTDVEYARIQGFPDKHCAAVPLCDRYTLFGNAIPPAMAGWAIDCLLHAELKASELKPNLPQFKQLSLFDIPHVL